MGLQAVFSSLNLLISSCRMRIVIFSIRDEVIVWPLLIIYKELSLFIILVEANIRPVHLLIEENWFGVRIWFGGVFGPVSTLDFLGSNNLSPQLKEWVLASGFWITTGPFFIYINTEFVVPKSLSRFCHNTMSLPFNSICYSLKFLVYDDLQHTMWH